MTDFREKHRTSQFFNHLSAVSESIPALGWVTVSPAPAPFVKEMNDAGQFYTNRVLKEWKERDKKHVDWVKSWIQTLTDLQAFVKQHHTTGLIWAGKGSAAVPPPPPGCPPPPPVLADFNTNPAAAGGDADRSALFAQINQGENITRSRHTCYMIFFLTHFYRFEESYVGDANSQKSDIEGRTSAFQNSS